MILIIEDDVRLALSIQDSLSYLGYEVKYFTNVEACMKELEKGVPKLIICDILLPDHDGFYLLNFIRSQDKFDKAAFIFISALIDTEFVVKGLKAGAQDYLRKPFSIKELDIRVKNVLGQQSYGVTLQPEPKATKLTTGIDLNDESHETNLSEHVLVSVNAILADHISDKSLNAKKLARLMGMNDFNLKNLIYKKTGFTVSQYIKDYKWKRAKDILITKGGNVYETSEALGFINYNYFITKFRKVFNETPKQYYLRILALKSDSGL
jgi:DNA-binding response OmpR family regulator